MKKVLFIITIALICSCTKSTLAEATQEEQSYESLKSELLELNSTLPVSERIETKGFKWWHYAIVGAVDAAGGFIPGGNVASAISASTLAWGIIKDSRSVATKSLGSTNNNDISSINTSETALNFIDGNGEIHNKVIINLYEKYGESLFEKDEKELTRFISEEVSKETKTKFSDNAISEKQLAEIKAIVNAYISSETIDEFINKLQLTSPEQSQLLEILNVILDGYDSLDVTNDNGKYEKSVQRIINNSQIPKSSKDKLNDAVSVANASSRLWNVNFK